MTCSKKGHQTSLVIVIMGLNVGVQSPAVILFHPYRVTLNYDDHVRPKQKMLIILFSFMVHKNTVTELVFSVIK